MTRSAGDQSEAAAARPVRGSRAWLVLAALVAGLVAGALARGLSGAVREPALQVTGLVGGLWLDALQMVVIPLIVSLLIVGIAKGAEAARAGRVAARSIVWFAAVYVCSAVLGVLAMPLLLGLFPLPAAAADALRAGLASIDPQAVAASVPEAGDFFRSIVPDNVVGAAAEGSVLPLVFFTLLFGIAATRIDEQRRRSVVTLFEGIADALLVVIGWVLWIAPLGVFALAFTLGAGAGTAALGAVVHYVLLVSALGLVVMLAGYVIAVAAGGLPPGRFAKAMIAPQAVAISTQSSLASLPAMLAAARNLGLTQRVADVTLPLAVALFRATGPAMNIGVAFYVGHWLGLEPSFAQLAAATAVAAVASIGSPSLPGQISFLTAIAPIAMAMGVPIAPLAILVAVENIPDIMRTVGNVTLDVAVTSAVDRGEPESTPDAVT
jgi:Na+/H+-dicarboxylate symporter